jgi:hypothetical protein
LHGSQAYALRPYEHEVAAVGVRRLRSGWRGKQSLLIPQWAARGAVDGQETRSDQGSGLGNARGEHLGLGGGVGAELRAQ